MTGGGGQGRTGRRRLAAAGLALAAGAVAAPLRAPGAQQPPAPAGAGRRRAAAGSRGAMLGVYVGNSPDGVLQFERWLGREVDGVLGYTGGSWEEIRNPDWFLKLWSRIDRPVFWSVPLVADEPGRGLEEAASGARNAYYRDGARLLATFRPQDQHLFVRTGWEFNGDWFGWSAPGRERAFVGAFRNFVDSFRSVSDRFRFEWNVTIGGSKTDPERCWPGDAYVDVVGMDFYFTPQYLGTDPVAAWESLLNEPRGLRWHQDFARARGKPTAYSEWGVTTDNAAPFLERAKAWFDAHDVLYQTYWSSEADFPGKLSGGRFPRTGAAYVQLFSRDPPRRHTRS